MSLNVYIVRHGETTWNRDDERYCGSSDPPLTAAGRRQAGLTAEALAPVSFDAAYASPLARSRETAEILIEGRGLETVVDERLREVDFGEWEGMTKDEIREQAPTRWREWRDRPDRVRPGVSGELAGEAFERADAGFGEIVRRNREGSVLVVAHNTLNRIWLVGSIGAPLRNYRKIVQNNAAISICSNESGSWIWHRINETGHLTDEVRESEQKSEEEPGRREEQSTN